MIPATMTGVQLIGYGGLDKLQLRDDLPTPQPGPGEVLIQVSAAGMNNTDINTRTGWYSQTVESGTTADGGQGGFGVESGGMGDWGGDIAFPRIQGADVVGRIVAVGAGVAEQRLGERVVCDPYLLDPDDETGLDSAGFLGAAHDGGFAQFTCVPDSNAVAIPEGVAASDAEIATLPCSGGTAMNMYLMAGLEAGDRVLVTGASGGVGSFLVQIAKHAGAEVVGVCGRSKAQAVRDLGADAVVDRAAEDLVGAAMAATGARPYTLVADVVGGPQFAQYLALLARGGRYVTAGTAAEAPARVANCARSTSKASPSSARRSTAGTPSRPCCESWPRAGSSRPSRRSGR